MSILTELDWSEFDAIYLINLPERTDRRKELSTELNSVGLTSDNRKLVWIPAIRPADVGEFPSIGARGCFMSHLKCLQSALNSSQKCILIMEDDACFPRSVADKSRRIFANLKAVNWDIWYGGYLIAEDDSPVADDGLATVAASVGIQTTHCIGIRGDSIRSIKEFLELILTRPRGHPVAGPMHVDGAYSTWRKLNPDAVTIVSVPPICIQRSSRSDVADRHWADSMPILRQGVAALRRLRNRMSGR